jgi:hypothetical protein
MEDAVNRLTRLISHLGGTLTAYKLAQYMRGRRQFLNFSNTDIVGDGLHGSLQIKKKPPGFRRFVRVFG